MAFHHYIFFSNQLKNVFTLERSSYNNKKWENILLDVSVASRKESDDFVHSPGLYPLRVC